MFKKINKNKAYLLGFLLTDGNLDKDRYVIGIELQVGDKQILDDISNIFGGAVKPQHKYDENNNKILKSYRWRLPISEYGERGYGEELYSQLEKFYIVPQKTGFEELYIFNNEKLMKYFLRGIWDGDGSFYIRSQKVKKIGKINRYLSSSLVSASKIFILQVQEYLKKCGINSRFETEFKEGYNNPVYLVKLCVNSSKKLFNYLYSGGGIKLIRKYNIALKGINIKKDEIYWTEKEIKFLKNNYKKLSLREIAKRLNRTFKAVEIKIFRLKLRKNERYWTEKQIEFLKNNHNKISIKKIAKKFKRTPKAVYIKIVKLGLRRKEINK